jgi:DNA-directed RNA polymerase subunit G
MISMSLDVKDLQPSKLEGVKIARAEGDGKTVVFDVIENLYTVNVGDRLELIIDEAKPSDLDSFDFCGHGYLVVDEGAGYSLLSLWGILYKFTPPLGLKPETKYYLCVRKARS